MIKTGVRRLRDPFILLDDGVYYMYGTDVFGDNQETGTKWGCYKNASGKLLMIWSYFYDSAYCVGIAQSDNGKLSGKWKQQDKLLFTIEETVILPLTEKDETLVIEWEREDND